MNMTLNINVQLGVSPEMAELVTAILRTKAMPQINQVVANVIKEAAEEVEAPTPKKPRKAKAEPSEVVEETKADEAKEETKEEATAEAAKAPTAEPTEEDVRQAMHETRQRFEGENYKENTESDDYKRYHRQLTAQFKNIAAVLGAEKPSTLDIDKRAAFIQQCAELTKDATGETVVKQPF